jgi:thymidylate synthase (FAD)
MKIIKSSVEILDDLNPGEILKKLELCGRVCYKSEDKITDESAVKFISNIIKRGHESVLEHVSFSVRFICDRGVTHEMVRHRIASYSQESTRYCNYAKGDFNSEITVILPSFFDTGMGTASNSLVYDEWKYACISAERHYFKLLEMGATPEQARTVLPNSLKTEIIMTANIREWRHFLKLRTSKAAHPQIREVAKLLLDELTLKLPGLFDDI